MRIFVLAALMMASIAPAAAEILGPDDAVAVSGLVQERLNATDIDVKMVGEKPYAIAYWSAGRNYAAGEALTKKSKSGWTIVKVTNGKFTESALHALGVPEPTSKVLMGDLKRAAQ